MRGINIKIGTFIVFCIINSVPLLFYFTTVNKKIPLKGAVVLNERPDLNVKNWVEGTFQEKFEKHINDNFGFRPFFVRVRNQIAFSFYNKLNAAYVIRGDENYLYEINYIKAYNGTDFIGVDSVFKNSLKIRELEDSLQNVGKTLIVCFVPGKGSFYPEYFPDKFRSLSTDTTNYKFYKKAFIDLDINYIDFNQWFLDMKDTSRFILYPRYGIHWSFYGMLLSADSLISYIENIRNIDMPDIQLSDFKITKKLNNSDYDIADGLNLVFKLPRDYMCYPAFRWEDDTNKDKPKVIVIADSFYWSMYGTDIWHKSFSPGGFWYYNRQIYPESFSDPLKVEEINQKEAIERNDVFILMVTEANLPKFPWGFVDNFLEAVSPGYDKNFEEKKWEALNFEKELQNHIRNIKANENWMKEIRRKASEKNISVDSMLVLDATWMIEYKKSQQQK